LTWRPADESDWLSIRGDEFDKVVGFERGEVSFDRYFSPSIQIECSYCICTVVDCQHCLEASGTKAVIQAAGTAKQT